MYRRDPIVSSSPPPGPQTRRTPFSDSEDELAAPHITQATMPLDLPDDGRSAFFAATTQPTQLLATPRAGRLQHSSQIQVARSSPVVDRGSSVMSQMSQPQRSGFNPMAPPGTYTLLPPTVPRPAVVDLCSDDPPVEPDSDEENNTLYRSNIRPSNIETVSRSSNSRIEETPQKPKFDMSPFMHTASVPRKRPAYMYIPDSPPPQAKKARSTPQTGPSRAMAVPQEIRLEDIVNPDHQKKSVVDLREALKFKRGNYHDALEHITDAVDDECLRTPEFMAQPSRSSPDPIVELKKTAQVSVKAPTKTLVEKYSRIHQSQNSPIVVGDDSPKQPRKKGRLVRGRRNRSPESQPAPSRPLHRNVLSDEEDEAIIIDDDSDSEAQASPDNEIDEGSLLDYFNACSVEAMVDLSAMEEDNIRLVFEHRPFRSLAAIEKIHVDSRKAEKSNGKKTRKPKFSFGERLVESARNMWNGYRAVDQLVKQCEALGKPIVSTMAKWGVDVFGATTDGEVALTALDDGSDTSSGDSGYHTPRSNHGSDTEGDFLRKATHRASSKKPVLLKKPSIMNDDVILKDYQVVGLNWLNLLWQNDTSGILADDMGLGKTCQVITFFSHLKEQGVPGPHLVVVPASTLENWCREFKRFAEKLEVFPYHGDLKDRAQFQDDILHTEKDVDVIITTYDIATLDLKFIRKCRPQACIFDEGHALKNSTTKRYQSMMKIDAKCRFLLTGTPLQNSLQELASILAFLMPEIFKEVQNELAVVFKHKAKVIESNTHGTLLSTQRINRARSMMTPFILRRKKAQVLKHLPKKTCRVEYCELTNSQKRLYNAQLQRQRQVMLDRAAGNSSTENFNVMMRLRQAAIHPLLFRDRYDENKTRKMAGACLKEPKFRNSDPEIIIQEMTAYHDYECHQLASLYPKALGKFMLKDNEWMDSGKVTKLVELLQKYRENGDRALIFSQFTSVMDILQLVLNDIDMQYFRLDGSTPINERQQMIDKFYTDESIPVFMLSTKSGGAGINLACANKVIIFDSSFNPQDDVQAENRAHRVGQPREVEVIRLVTKGTVEEQIYALGVSKLELDKMVSGEEVEGAKTIKTAGDKLSGAEKLGVEAVEKMMMEQLATTGEGDVKNQFMDGLKKAGLDLSAAEA
ncbi:SNF2 family N-terminal domain-containing protein [Massariosphaeria phaeospora]|uniref:DNA helicase n=1 Tax=Massariosphaeria phaeospora TaxID=100035 RepID=A0A7C8IEF2_9PLEO|nr:SNF2 family N-terminal domain-containing protein [Massariosphaeria phaeospora]